MKIRDISVRVKLQLGFLAILVLLMGVVVTGQIGMTNMRTRYEDVSRVERVQLLGRTMQAEWSEMVRAASIFMATRNANYADDFNRAADSLEAALRESWELIQLETSQATLSTIEANFKRYRSEVADFFRGSDVDRLAMEALREETSQLLAQFVDTGESQAELAAEEASRSAARARTIMWIVAAVASGAGVTIAAFLGRQIATPVTAIAHMASRMAEGDLTIEPLEVRNRDELGELARAFNQMLANMRDVLRRVRTGSEALTDSAKELSAAAESAAQASGGVAQAIAQVAAGATEQAGATQEVDATMEQLKEAIQQIAAGATRSAGETERASTLLHEMAERLDAMVADAAATADRASGAVEQAAVGAEVLQRALYEIQQIAEAMGETAARIRELERHSDQISAITEVIATIADQTNLLALNAAIEAARAGEHGRGFAVVADEVRKLAEQSGASSREIAELVRQIQISTAEAVRVTEQGTDRARSGNQLAMEAGRALEDIMDILHRAAESVSTIADAAERVRGDSAQVLQTFTEVAALTEENTAAAEEMAAGANEVTGSVARITEVAQANAAAAQEVSASVEELTAASEQVAATAQSLLTTVRELQSDVERFRL